MVNSRHFSIEELVDGIYAIIHQEGGWAVGNAGIIDMGDFTLVFDSTLTLEAGKDLREAAGKLTGKPIKFVVNSHYHNDHIWGNQVFDPETQIISSIKTRHLIQTEGQEEFDWYRDNSADQFKELREQYAQENKPNERQKISFWMSYFEGLAETVPLLQVRLPDFTFDDELEIKGSKRLAKLIAFDDAHTGNDAVLNLPNEGIVFMGDLLFVRSHPFLVEGDPENVIAIGEKVRGYGARLFVPGHGPVGSSKDLDLQKSYIRDCQDMARLMFDDGMGIEEIELMDVPEAYSEWVLPNFYAINLRHFYSSLSGQ